jgi:hypothetical protein
MSTWVIVPSLLIFNFKMIVMKKIFLILCFAWACFSSYSQTVKLHEVVDDTVMGKHGPNLKNFSHFYLGLGFMAGAADSTGSDILYGRSTDLVIGYRYKLRFSNFFAVGYDLSFNSYKYALKQDSQKLVPDTIQHNKENLSFNNLGASLYMRFNYGRRGNRVGHFIDLGGYGDWTFSAVNFTKDKRQNGNIVRTKISNLDYFNSTNYGLTARLGFNRYVFYGNYRLSDIFKSSKKLPEMPRLTIGLQIGFHR